MTRRIVIPSLLMLACALAQQAVAQATVGDPMAGSWKLDVGKSTFSPGPGPRAVTYRYENRPDGFTLWTQASVNAAGNPAFSFSLRKYDGKEYPVYTAVTLATLLTTGKTSAQTQEARVIDAYTTELVNRVDGKVTTIVTRTMARDGKTFTLRSKGRNAAGEPVDETSLWERQDGR
jgi:hypothetical protein